MLKYIVLGLVGIVVATMVYVRLAPLDVARLHSVELTGISLEEDYSAPDGHRAVRPTSDVTEALTLMDSIIMATPRTTRIAGSVEAGRITYVTRTRWMGFPDVTTVDGGDRDQSRAGADTTMVVYGRLQFGRSDLGVNRARIEGWMAQYDEAQQ